MRISRWLVAAGMLSFSGLALADESDDINQDQPKSKVTKSSEVQQGSDVRTSFDPAQQDMKQAGQEVKESAKEAKEGVQGAAVKTGEAGAAGAEKAGTEVGSAISEGGHAVAGQPSSLPQGFLRSGKAIRNTITTDPIGMAIGYGVNAEYTHALGRKWDVLGGARYAHTRLGDSSVNNFALDVGGDYYIIGRNNEGLRIGPRLEAGLGGGTGNFATVAPEAASLFGSLTAAGELGYTWIASNGLTAGAAAGLRGLITETNAGNNVNNSGTGPYAKINLGYSW